MLESAVERRFREQVRKAGGRSFKIPPADAGIPDRLVLFPGGRVYLVELKAPDGELREIQKIWHRRAAEFGTRVYVLTGNLEVDEWLRFVAP